MRRNVRAALLYAALLAVAAVFFLAHGLLGAHTLQIGLR